MKLRRIFRFERLESRTMLSASGDFNGDGFADLAIGTPGAEIGSVDRAGAVHVIYGGNSGLSASGDQYWDLETPGIDGSSGYDGAFGSALAAGDFNGDGFDDLAIGAAGVSVDGEGFGTGTVNVLYGSSTGLRATGDQRWSQNSPGVNGVANDDEGFGVAVATGDFNGDGFADLAIGVAFDNLPSITSAGAVNVLYGSANGLTSKNDQLWTQDSSGINGVPMQGEYFGYSLATGDFNGDGRDDLAIGVLRDHIGASEVGSVNIIYGGGNGLTGVGDQLWNQSSSGVSGIAEDGDRFGHALAIGDFDGDNFDDLAIGAPSGSVGGDSNAGEVNVLYGSAAKIQTTNQQLITRDSLGGTSVAQENFGNALAVGDFNYNGRDDLVVGAPFATLGGLFGVGYVQIVYGAANGLTSSGTQYVHQDTASVLDSNENNDGFGTALTTGDYNNDGRDDLAIGVPGQTVGGFSAAGQVAVLLGSASGITTVGNQIWNAGSAGIFGPFEVGGQFGGALA